MTSVLIERRNRDAKTQGEHCIKTGIMLPQANQLPGTRREAWTGPLLLEPSEGTRPYPHLDLGLSAFTTVS